MHKQNFVTFTVTFIAKYTKLKVLCFNLLFYFYYLMHCFSFNVCLAFVLCKIFYPSSITLHHNILKSIWTVTIITINNNDDDDEGSYTFRVTHNDFRKHIKYGIIYSNGVAGRRASYKLRERE